MNKIISIITIIQLLLIFTITLSAKQINRNKMGKILLNKDFKISTEIKNYDYLYLVFNRGFSWPFCRKHMMQLHQDIKKFEEKKIKIVAICPEKIKDIEKFSNKHQLDFDLVSDSNHILADKYGQQVVFLKLGRMPAQIIIDKEENVIFKHYANSMIDIIENNEILEKF